MNYKNTIELVDQARLRASSKCVGGYTVPFDVNLDNALADFIETLTRERNQERHARQLHSAEIAVVTLERDGARQWVEDVKNVQENANAEGYAEAKAHYEARIAKLEAALKPFAAMPCGICENDDPAIGVERCSDDTSVYVTRHDLGGQTVTAGHFRTARAALEES